MKILLVGSTSFIGKNLVKRFTSLGHEVYSLDRTRIGSKLNREKIFLYDITRPKTIIRAFRRIKNIDICINLAGGAGASQSNKSIFQVNYIGVKYLYNICKSYGVKQFIQFSSASIYGNVKKGKIIDENSKAVPFNNYSMAKLLADKYLTKNQNQKTKVLILRLPLVYGKNTSVTFSGLVEKIRASKFILFGKGNNVIHPLHVENLVDFLSRIVDSGKEESGLFVLSDKKYFDLSYLLETIKSRFKSDKSYRTLPLFILYILYAVSNLFDILLGKSIVKKENLFFYTSSRIIDCTKAVEDLNYSPVYNYEEKLVEAIDSFI